MNPYKKMIANFKEDIARLEKEMLKADDVNEVIRINKAIEYAEEQIKQCEVENEI